MSFSFVVRCPVCKVQMDTLTTGVIEVDTSGVVHPSGFGAASILGPSRRAHGRASPDCTKHKDWIHGWDFDPPLEIK